MSYFDVTADIMFTWNKTIGKIYFLLPLKNRKEKTQTTSIKKRKKTLEIKRIQRAPNLHPTQQNGGETCNVVLKMNEDRTRINVNVYTYYHWSKTVFRVPFLLMNSDSILQKLIHWAHYKRIYCIVANHGFESTSFGENRCESHVGHWRWFIVIQIVDVISIYFQMFFFKEH